MTEGRKFAYLLLPSNGGAFLVLILGLFLFWRSHLLLQDGGTARHIITGLYVLQNGHLPATNHITRLFADGPWLTNSVIFDTACGGMFTLFGFSGLVVIGALAVALAVVWSYQMARARGMSAAFGMLLMLPVVFVMSLHWNARPNIFSYLPFLLTYHLIFVQRLSPLHRTIAISLVMCLWANMHGSFYVGLGMLMCKVLGDLVAPPFDHAEAADRWRTNRWNLVTLAVAIMACCLNFSGGPAFLTYVLPYFHHITTKVNVDEWRSIDFTVGPRIWLFFFLAFIQYAIWTYSDRKPAASEFLYMCGLFFLGIFSMRMIPYFALLMPIACAASSDALFAKVLPPKLLEADARISSQEPQSVKAVALWTSLAAAFCIYFLVNPACAVTDFEKESLPTVCAQKLKEYPNTFGFTRDNWAGYLYLHTKTPIFIDDYHDFYSLDVIDDYKHIYFSYPDWKQRLSKYNFDWVLVPNIMPLQLYLRDDKDWRLVCQDDAGVLFERANLRTAHDGSAK